MNSELSLMIGKGAVDVFMQDGFFCFDLSATPRHCHRYPEIHLLARGSAVLELEGESISLSSGSMFVIESGVYHRCISNDDSVQHIAFQCLCDCVHSGLYTVPHAVLPLFLEAVNAYRTTGKKEMLKGYLSLFCAFFIPEAEAQKPQPIQDRGFIIYEFFAKNYDRDVTLSDLALALCVGEKQAERLVVRYTGRNFRCELVHFRMEAAKRLMETGQYSLTDIAAKIGYRSYSGFRKAWLKEMGGNEEK